MLRIAPFPIPLESVLESWPMVELPLFPLNTVLFPTAPLTLHIFEERYKEMVSRCIAEDIPFGVVLIREGQEVGSPALPFEVGTTAQIVSVEKLLQGRMNLIAVGRERFRLLDTSHARPYLVGRVEFAPHLTGFHRRGHDPATSGSPGQVSQPQDLVHHQTADTHLFQILIAQAGQNRHRQHKGPRRPRRLGCRLQHLAAPAGMDGQHADFQLGCFCHCRGHGIRNVMEFQVEEDFAARVNKLADDLRAFGRKKLFADLKR